MDHLWIDHDLQQEPDLIPYLDPGQWQYTPDEDDDENAWLSKLQSSLNKAPPAPAVPPITPEIFLQEAIFFRLLSKFKALLHLRPLRREDFIKSRNGEAFLSTLNLHDLAREMVEARLADFRPENQDLVELVVSPLQQRERERGIVLSPEEARGLFGAVCEEIPEVGKLVLLGRLPCDTGLLEGVDGLFREFTEILTEGLRGNERLVEGSRGSAFLGCCVLLESLSRAFEVIYGHFGSEGILRDFVTLPKDAVWLERARRNGVCAQRVELIVTGTKTVSMGIIATSMRFGGSHGACEFGRFCRAEPAKAELPKHFGCEGCRMVVLADKGKLERCIETVGYGLLRFGDGVDFDVVKEGSYVAFSHVWSHGLGNPVENGLPECQLRRLKRYVADAGCDTFWLDPICVPLDSTWKLRAVQKMDVVYKKAAKVIVLDNDLLRCSGNAATKRIAMLLSDWITRIWTLQEASFPADRLYIAFADGLLHANTLLNDNWEYMICTDETFLAKTMLLRNDSVLALAENFHNRTTSHAEDEAICLSILLNVEISKTVPEAIGRLDSVEQDLIYAPGARCDRNGWKWCPVSLISTDRRKPYLPNQTRAMVGERGLLMKKDVVKLGMMKFSASTKYLIWFLEGQEPLVAFYEFGLGATEQQLASRWIEDAALILEKSSDLKDPVSGAILVNSSTTFAHYECMLMTVELRTYVAAEGMGIMRAGVEIYASRIDGYEMWVD